MKQLKCPVCETKDYESNMVVDYIGNVKKRFHPDCHEQYLEEREFKKQEKKEMDSLVETIKKVHKINVIPNQFYSYLQDLRNGNELFGNIGKKKSKQGYRYYVISETYEECQDKIDWAIDNKNFKGVMPMLKYTLSIIKDKISNVNQSIKRQEQQEKALETEQLDQSYDYGFDTFNYKEKEDEQDISDML